MTNEIIGIACAIAVTFLLFALRHFILRSETDHERHSVPTASRERPQLDKPAGDPGDRHYNDAQFLLTLDAEHLSKGRTHSYEDCGR